MTQQPSDGRGFRLVAMFHPSAHVTDLEETERFYARVFGRSSTPIETILRDRARPGFPIDYATFTPIADVLMDSVDPERYVVDEVQQYASVEAPHLKNLGWYVDGMPELFIALQRHGFGVANGSGQLVEGADPPKPTFFSVPSETGFRHQFYPNGVFTVDPRQDPGWTLPTVSHDDPLGIRRCSHHTILTSDPGRQLRLVVDALGGTVVHEGRDELRGLTSVYVHLADSILEYAVPDPGTAAHADWAADEPFDTYHAITWQVADLERAERHLSAQGVRIRARSGDTVITEPSTSLGIPWGFTSTRTPGDPRG